MFPNTRADDSRLISSTFALFVVVLLCLRVPANAHAQAAYDVVAAFGERGDGLVPVAELLLGSDGSLYGTTTRGGAFGYGTVFKLNPLDRLTTLHAFNSTDGAEPYGGLIRGSDGSLYGTTRIGGAHDFGTVFKLDPAGILTTLHSFNATDGAFPFSRLLRGTDGSLYGTTAGGGPDGENGWGTVFKLDPAGDLTTFHAFDFSDGAFPVAGLIQGSDGNFYGTSYGGGSGGGRGDGTVFRLDSSGTLVTLPAFDEDDGDGARRPFAGLIEANDGNFYGTTTDGGTTGYGTVFKIDPLGTLTTLHSFDYLVDGARPYGGLLQGSDGNFYGTTNQGGAFGTGGSGTIFKLDSSGNLTTLAVLGLSESYPYGGLVQGSNGSLYGTASMRQGGGDGRGSIFELTTAGALITRHRFLFGSRGVAPLAGLIQGSDGSFYGTTYSGGAFNGGTIHATDGHLYGTAPQGGPEGGGVVFRLRVGESQ